MNKDDLQKLIKSITNYRKLYEKSAKEALKQPKGSTTPLDLEDRVRDHWSADGAAKALEMCLTIIKSFNKKETK